ncbi:MAG: methyltransferase domain-containing protein [Candidatus Thermoplasmatota archaeon]|nr:methyltransferase domain-containing protein [Candidatus Thermoplasmatota archaeon]
MNLLFELSGEHPRLPRAEAAALLALHDSRARTLSGHRVWVAEAEVDEKTVASMAERLALSYGVHVVLATGTLESVTRDLEQMDLSPWTTFSIQGRRFHHGHSISRLKQHLGAVIRGRHGLEVDLENPDLPLFVVADDHLYLCRVLAPVDRAQFERRRPHHRAFSSPISLHPRLARALVNLSGVRPGQTLLDPFCGTGGILIEAGLVGARVVGMDIKPELVEGCRANLAQYGITPAALYCGDATAMILKEPANVVVTDMPYGRSTYVGNSRTDLYHRAFQALHRWLPPGGWAVVGLPDEQYIPSTQERFIREDAYALRAHRSLTRHFCVLRRP